jgi:hypothetical protein
MDEGDGSSSVSCVDSGCVWCGVVVKKCGSGHYDGAVIAVATARK